MTNTTANNALAPNEAIATMVLPEDGEKTPSTATGTEGSVEGGCAREIAQLHTSTVMWCATCDKL